MSMQTVPQRAYEQCIITRVSAVLWTHHRPIGIRPDTFGSTRSSNTLPYVTKDDELCMIYNTDSARLAANVQNGHRAFEEGHEEVRNRIQMQWPLYSYDYMELRKRDSDEFFLLPDRENKVFGVFNGMPEDMPVRVAGVAYSSTSAAEDKMVDLIQFGKTQIVHRGETVHDGDMLMLIPPTVEGYRALRKDAYDKSGWFGMYKPVPVGDGMYAATQSKLGVVWENLKEDCKKLHLDLEAEVRKVTQSVQRNYSSNTSGSYVQADPMRGHHQVQRMQMRSDALLNFICADPKSAEITEHGKTRFRNAFDRLVYYYQPERAAESGASERVGSLDQSLDVDMAFRSLSMSMFRHCSSDPVEIDAVEIQLSMLHQAFVQNLMYAAVQEWISSHQFLEFSNDALTGFLESWVRLSERSTFAQRRRILGFALADARPMDDLPILVNTI